MENQATTEPPAKACKAPAPNDKPLISACSAPKNYKSYVVAGIHITIITTIYWPAVDPLICLSIEARRSGSISSARIDFVIKGSKHLKLHIPMKVLRDMMISQTFFQVAKPGISSWLSM